MSMAVRCRRRDLVPRYSIGPYFVRPLAIRNSQEHITLQVQFNIYNYPNNHLFKHASFPGTSLQNLQHAFSVTSSNSNFFPINSKAARLSDLAIHTAIGSCSSRQRNIIEIRQWQNQTLRLLAMVIGYVRAAKLRTSPRTQSSTAYRAVTIRPATLPAQADISSLHIFIVSYELQHTAMNDGYELWHCYECDADNPDWHTEQCPVCGTPRPEQSRMSSTPMNTLGGAGSPAEGIWECSNCGAVNSAMHWNQCGECAFLN
ncbi:hypothetical protein SNOG_00020 [Parastagonospora nodorum SN15]|uniref:RanBP2-type domain-containing protein n=1 Tax=Phaeosphaeria nodorum (strain SN15 / ATCC MYA-4574 / FGSC 10173) TaxID=321614 RepID=Q0V7J4_PHANO|nr:hypothetical protein SNOG_00020 [Parastagonospora nodorum SN15]EAT91515.1 hypothetical protein SNOG_00020 [Parastagonospora nodorum SN15]